MQLRYRHALKQRREQYVVYARGGDKTLARVAGNIRSGQCFGDLLRGANGLRNAVQLLVKLR